MYNPFEVGQDSLHIAPDGLNPPARINRRRELVNMPFPMQCALDGRLFLVQLGTEDAPVTFTTTIDDQLAIITIDLSDGTVIIPLQVQVVFATLSTATAYNVMVEVDNAKNRYSTGGTAFTPLNLRTDAPRTSACTCYVTDGSDITAAAKTSSGSLELFRWNCEDNIGTDTGTAEALWQPTVPPVLVDTSSLVIHGGGATADPAGYASVIFAEFSKSEVT